MNENVYLLSLQVFTAVLVVMAALVGLVHVLAHLGERQAREVREDSSEGEPSSELIAVLTAAAQEMLGTSVCLHRVQVHRDAAHPRWARAGRMDIMYSHRVEPRR